MKRLLVVLLLCVAGASAAVEPDEILADPALEARHRARAKAHRSRQGQVKMAAWNRVEVRFIYIDNAHFQRAPI